MPDTKAISPAVRGLFDTIKKQAAEYTRAFDDLQAEMERIKRDRKSLSNTNAMLTSKVDASIAEMINTVENALNELENKTAVTLRNFEDHDRIVRLRSSLEDLHTVLSSQQAEMQTLITNFKAKSGLELESTLINIKGRINKEVASELKKIEHRLARNLSGIENKLSNTEEHVRNILNQKSSETHRLFSEINEINTKIETFRQSTDELVRIMFDRLESYQKDVKADSAKLNSTVRQMEDKFSSLVYGSAAPDSSGGEKQVNEYGGLSKMNNRLPLIEEELSLVKMQMKAYQRLLWTTILLSAIAIVGLLILFTVM